MDITNILNTLFGNSQQFTNRMSSYTAYLTIAALSFSLLNCFFGYKLRKLWSCIFGMLLGIGTGISLAMYLHLDSIESLAAAFAGGLIFLILSFVLYRIGLFFLCIGIVIFTLFHFFPTPTFSAICGFVVFGIAIGFLAIIKEPIIVSTLTALYGATGSAISILSLAGSNNIFLTILLSIVFAVLGLTFQLKPWKKRKRGRKKSKKRKKQTFTKQPQQSSNQAAGKTKIISDTNTKPYKPPKNHDYGKDNLENNVKDTSAESDSHLNDSDYTVDLSDVRSEISKEVRDIYNEDDEN